MRKACRGTIAQIPKRRDDDRLRAPGDQFAKCFGEGEVPADQHSDFAQRGVECHMRVVQG